MRSSISLTENGADRSDSKGVTTPDVIAALEKLQGVIRVVRVTSCS
jgi:hypothetical protein